MRVLYFHQHFSTPKGAVGTRSFEMAQKLIAKGHKVTMVCGSYAAADTGLKGAFSRGRRQGNVDGIDVLEFDLGYSNADSLPKRSLVFLKFAFSSIRLAIFSKYDIVFATTTPLTAGIPGICARWFRRKPFVFEVRDLWPELPRAMGVITNPVILWMMSVLEFASYRSANRCIALSPGIATGIEKRGVSKERITLVPNGCDIDIFQAGKSHSWRPDGVKNDDLMAIYTGTHGQANGLHRLLDVAAVLGSRQKKNIKLVLVGAGKLKPELLAKAKARGLENIIFHQPVSKIELAGLMASADVGLQCLANIPAFYYGTSPNKFFDYISAGLPVINNYPGWLAEMITTENCGWAVPADDAEIFADVLIEAQSNPSALKKMGENALSLAKRDFARANLSENWVNWVIGAVGK